MPHLSCGIIGLPNAGKSTLFNALTSAGAEVAAYPFCTITPNVGVVPVKDQRVDALAEYTGVADRIYQTVEFVDVAGLVKDASHGAGRGNEFLDHVRGCDALIHVVRCFRNADVAHVAGRLDPADDISTVETELILADIQTVQREHERTAKRARHEPEQRARLQLLEKCLDHLDRGRPLRALELNEQERRELGAEARFLTDKSILYVANIDEADLADPQSNELVSAVRKAAQSGDSKVITICAGIEQEVAALEPEEAAIFIHELGLSESGLQLLARETADLLNLISFITFNDKEIRAWTIPAGTRAQDAAGAIHTDFARHFIRAEVTAYPDFAAAGGIRQAREKGLTRTEGRDYIVKDGDIIYFRIGP